MHPSLLTTRMTYLHSVFRWDKKSLLILYLLGMILSLSWISGGPETWMRWTVAGNCKVKLEKLWFILIPVCSAFPFHQEQTSAWPVQQATLSSCPPQDTPPRARSPSCTTTYQKHGRTDKKGRGVGSGEQGHPPAYRRHSAYNYVVY